MRSISKTLPSDKAGFCSTIRSYDENASCHLALGMASLECIEGGLDMSREELSAHGLNSKHYPRGFYG